MSESTMEDICVGTRVIDIEDEDPNVGIVVAKPPEQTIADWEFQTDDGTTTTADTNPDYPTETQLVIVVFETALDEYWPKWDEAAPDDFFDGVREHDVYHYGFPEPRLAPADKSGEERENDEAIKTTEPNDDSAEDDEADDQPKSDSNPDPALDPDPPGTLLELGERLKANGATVTTERGGLIVEKLGEKYRVTPGGKVEGDGAFAESLASLAAEYVTDTVDECNI